MNDIIIFPPNRPVLLQSYRYMCNKWCRWIISIPKSESPTMHDARSVSTSAFTDINTVFLCQSFDFQCQKTGREGSIAIPQGWNVFMPIINWISILEREEIGKEEYFTRMAEERMDEAANLNIKVNGIQIPITFNDFRIKAIKGRIQLPEHNIFDMDPGVTSYIADGFWIFFKPLTSDLTLETYGSCQSGIIQISSKYRVKSEEG